MTQPRIPVAGEPVPRTSVPRLLVLTDRAQARSAGRSLPATVLEAASAGAHAVLMREKDLSSPQRRDLATQLSIITADFSTQLLVASDPELAAAVGRGVHLAAIDDPVPAALRQQLLVGRSCHDRTQVAAAVAEGVDYVTVSPVALTASKPGYGPALGIDGLAALIEVAGDVPVLALGGVQPDTVAGALEAGAHGVAVMGAVMRAETPAKIVTRLLDQLKALS